jgi:hypothetical protein
MHITLDLNAFNQKEKAEEYEQIYLEHIVTWMAREFLGNGL